MSSGIIKRGLNEFEAMNVIGRLAANKAVADPQYTPIRLRLKENKNFFITSCDVFKLHTVQNQRGKDIKNVEIILSSMPKFKERTTFVEDPDSFESFASPLNHRLMFFVFYSSFLNSY